MVRATPDAAASVDAATDWSRGAPDAWLRDTVAYWRDGFDWRAFERRVNALPQFTTEVDGQRIHFLHVRSTNPDATPLILTHGWPGSFVEFLGLIGPLTEPQDHGGDAADAFHVVIPSIPGFAFSSPLVDASWDDTHVARAFARAHDAARLRALRRAGRRRRCRHLARDRPRGPGAGDRRARQRDDRPDARAAACPTTRWRR